MSAETLRRAASLMRERADAAKAWDGNWQVHDTKPGRVIEVKGDGWDDAIIASCVDYGGTENGTEYATHIASWHPAVALAVADLLEWVADGVAAIDGLARITGEYAPHLDADEASRSKMFAACEQHAIAIATAYLGDS